MASIILNSEKLKASLLTSGTRQRCPFSSLLFNIMLKFLANSIKQKILKKEIKYTQIEMKHKYVFVHTWHDCLYRN